MLQAKSHVCFFLLSRNKCVDQCRFGEKCWIFLGEELFAFIELF